MHIYIDICIYMFIDIIWYHQFSFFRLPTDCGPGPWKWFKRILEPWPLIQRHLANIAVQGGKIPVENSLQISKMLKGYGATWGFRNPAFSHFQGWNYGDFFKDYMQYHQPATVMFSLYFFFGAWCQWVDVTLWNLKLCAFLDGKGGSVGGTQSC